jgi:hypothetical protein
MCDYSLHHVASTPAQVGDKLVTTSFSMSGTRGFAAEGRPDVVVCIPPGAELAFEKDVCVDRALGLLPSRKIAARVARFREVNMDQPYAYHDALEFPDGLIIHLTNLAVGQRATVLQLPAQPRPEGAEPAARPQGEDVASQASLPLPSPHREIV